MLYSSLFPGAGFFHQFGRVKKTDPDGKSWFWPVMTRGQRAGTLGIVAARKEMNHMNGELKPTPMPEDLRRSLYVVLERIRFAEFFDLSVPDEWLRDALEVIRCHLVGIAATEEYEAPGPHVRGEGWSL